MLSKLSRPLVIYPAILLGFRISTFSYCAHRKCHSNMKQFFDVSKLGTSLNLVWIWNFLTDTLGWIPPPLYFVWFTFVFIIVCSVDVGYYWSVSIQFLSLQHVVNTSASIADTSLRVLQLPAKWKLSKSDSCNWASDFLDFSSQVSIQLNLSVTR